MKELFLDVDGVILDFETAFIDMLRKQYFSDLPTNFSFKTWEMDDLKGINITKALKQFWASDQVRNLEPLCDVESFNYLSSKYKVYLISNFPFQYKQKRHQNLKKLGLQYEELFCTFTNFGNPGYHNKSKIIQSVRNKNKKTIFCDDNPQNCKTIQDKVENSKIYLMTQIHNHEYQEDQQWTRVHDWKDFFTLVTNS